jgi:hypothetical protein
VSAENSLVGSTTGDLAGRTIRSLANGNALVIAPNWDNQSLINAGAVTFIDGKTGARGPIDASNSLIGAAANAEVDFSRVILDDVNQNFYAAFPADGSGRVRVGSQIDGTSRRWHNASRPTDINNDLVVAPSDALDVINYINAGFASKIADDGALGHPYGFLDVSGDNHVAPNDALEIINAINAGLTDATSGGEGEGEGQPQSFSGLDSSAIDEVFAESNPPLETELALALLAISEAAHDGCTAAKTRRSQS